MPLGGIWQDFLTEHWFLGHPKALAAFKLAIHVVTLVVTSPSLQISAPRWVNWSTISSEPPSTCTRSMSFSFRFTLNHRHTHKFKVYSRFLTLYSYLQCSYSVTYIQVSVFRETELFAQGSVHLQWPSTCTIVNYSCPSIRTSKSIYSWYKF